MEAIVSYDQRCFELAEFFLIDEPELRHRASELAQQIQDAIEDWFMIQNAEKENGENSE